MLEPVYRYGWCRVGSRARGLVAPRVEPHLFYNSVVLIPMVIAVWHARRLRLCTRYFDLQRRDLRDQLG